MRLGFTNLWAISGPFQTLPSDSPQSFKAGTSCQGHGKPPIYGNTQLAGIRSDTHNLHTPDTEIRISLTQ